MSADPSIAARVREILADTADLEVPSEEQDLLASGRLDSLVLVELVFALEQELGVTLPLEELDVEHFRSVRTIAELVARLAQEQEVAPARHRDHHG